MELTVVECRVEHSLLGLRAALHGDAAEGLFPCLTGVGTHGVKGFAPLFGLQILTGIGYADERDAHLHLHLLAFGAIVAEEVAHLIARHLARVVRVELVTAVVLVPLGFHSTERGLLFPIAGSHRSLVDTQHEVDGEYRLTVITERSQKAMALNLGVADTLYHASRLIGQTVTHVEQYVGTALRKGVTLNGAAHGSRRLGPDTVFLERQGVITGRGFLVLVFRAIVVVIHVERPRGGHGEQRSQLGTAHTAHRDMA